MSGIEDLRQRVQDAEQRFGLAREEQAKYSTRLIGLIDEVEGRLRSQQAEIERERALLASHDEAMAKERAQASRHERENEQLRAMLHTLLQAIESGGRSNLAEIMHTLEQKVTALIAGTETPAEAAAEPSGGPVDESAAELEMIVEPEPEMLVGAVPVVEAEPAPEAQPEAAPEPELATVPEPETVIRPEAEMSADSEPAADAEIEAEMASEPEPVVEPELGTEAAAEPEPEPMAEPEAEAPIDTPASDNMTLEALKEAARELAAAPSNPSAAESNSLHEIMDRVSRLVREAENPGAPPSPSSPAKKSATG